MDNSRVTKKVLLVSLMSGMGVFLEGYDFTNIASALIFLIPYFSLDALQTSVLALSTYAGTFVGAILIGNLADLFGRRAMYIADIVFYIVFAIMSGLSTSYMMLVVARLGLGFGIGADQALSFSIIGETSPAKKRGQLNAMTWIMWTIASLLAYVFAYTLSPVFGMNTWRIIFLLSVIPGVIVVIGRSFIPETPRWLIAHGRLDEAKKSAKSFFGVDIDVEAAAVETTLNLASNTNVKEKNISNRNRWRELFVGKQLRKTIYITVMWLAITINTYGIAYFTPFIFKTLGFTARASLFGGMLVAVFSLAGSITMFLLVEKIGRKTLAITGFAGLTIVDTILSIFGHGAKFDELLVLFSVFEYVAWVGPAGLVGVVAPEVFPTDIRSTGTGFAAAFGRIGSMVGIFLAPLLILSVGLSHAMIFYGADAFIALLVMIFLGVETKGKTLEQLTENKVITR